MAHSGINILFAGTNFSRLLGGLWISAKISIVALVFGIALGIFLGALRTVKNPILRVILRLYLEFFRIVPTVVLLFLFYYILPKNFNVNLNAQAVAMLVFALWVGAEMSDIVRGALISVPQHQREAGIAIGLNGPQLFRYVLLPQAIGLMIPATINLMTRVIKTTSLLLLISVMDVINIGQQIIEANRQHYPDGAFWVYGLIFILYFLLCYPLSAWARHLERRQNNNA
ncbi:amino acid ABC transporter permease [Loigolactobacillus coryniformis]|uniref:Polar amino acid ABC transporter inner membrane subunit n=3 Tax=Loigolactobacillus coryniformis TaxID=1610 RepID=A0A0R1F2J9_9LACO|nr:amino acid ABC transporter permease [Loigolactobacillus coryniformis]MDT3391911.1 amino acid ABC transporter permease [Bacillota bacterium]OEH90939.1 amino acid ABC transporter permease [Loigolactobacillus coryniformis subsp. coryniformis]RRG05308.1 MAG: amino acid ABC transporter permease [Lactobacillus sp.]ATO42516.1 amino acid ABC transporter permease [Loigolactobacillus coryniformis subsp. torquens DSM 20004 = KCTC 3535]ATO54179.1 amino acid ABC transporter permease [Loigolactobacillus 